VKRGVWIAVVLIALACAAPVLAQAPQPEPSRVDVNVTGVGSISAPLQIVLLLTLLTFVPAILVTMTSFTRIVIVFHFLRQALGTQEMPPNQVLIGLALFLTMFIMAPVGTAVNDTALQPAVAGQISVGEAIERATPPMRAFMLKQTRERDLALFVELGRIPKPQTPDDLPMRVVVPAYVISEMT
jgi:flagellar biosynthetic protein FliP